MSDQAPIVAGWYPDPGTGGTRHWDGSRWSGATRPRRKPFAADANHGSVPHLFTLMGGVSFGVLCMMAAFDAGFSIGYFLLGMAFLLGSAVTSLYFLRGRGPTTKEVEKALAARRQAEDEATAKAAKMTRRRRSLFSINVAAPDVVGVAQVHAVASPETARALQNLQNLLYTQAITDEEYQAAKEKLFGTSAIPDSFMHISKLAELHRAGILGDVEFAAAKAKALGI